MTTQLIRADEPSLQTELIATKPQDIATAQQSLLEFFGAKVETAKTELADCEANLKAADAASVTLNLAPFSRQVSRALKRLQYYSKALAAVEAGYVLVPSFPGMERFMVRTNRKNPDKYSGSQWKDRSQTPRLLPVGEGEYKDSEPVEFVRTIPGAEGKPVKEYFAKHFRDHIEYPVSVANSVVIEKLDQAAQLKIFDDFGVCPGRTKPGDPIVVGRIYDPKYSPAHWNARALNFLVAWYLDTRTL